MGWVWRGPRACVMIPFPFPPSPLPRRGAGWGRGRVGWEETGAAEGRAPDCPKPAAASAAVYRIEKALLYTL